MLDNIPTNEQGFFHGPYQDYWVNGLPWETSHYVNGEALGYSEINHWSGDVDQKEIFYFCR